MPRHFSPLLFPASMNSVLRLVNHTPEKSTRIVHNGPPVISKDSLKTFDGASLATRDVRKEN